MGLIKKFLDYGMTGNWEETQRIELYRKLGKKLDNMDSKQLKKLSDSI